MPASRSRFPLAARIALAAAALVVFGAACGGSADGEDEGGNQVDYGGSGAAAAPDRLEEEAGAGTGAYSATGGSAIPSVGASIIKTADLRLEVEAGDFEQAIDQVESVAPRYGGFVLSTSLDDTSTKRGTVVIRVPSEDFERAVGDVKDTGELLGEEIAGQDVSQEFIDLEARIRNLEAQETVFLDLMDRATTIGETITVQNQLSGLQLDIERLQGRLNFLRDRTALGTISVSLAEAGAPAPGEPNVFASAWNQSLDILEGIGATLIVVVVGFAFPLGLLALIGVFVFRQVKPRLTP